MIGAGTIINPIIKIVTTVAILGACYLFFVKPALDTTENISENVTESTQSIQQNIREDINKSLEGVPDITVPQIPNSAKKAQKLGDCMTAAAGDIDKIQRCSAKFGS